MNEVFLIGRIINDINFEFMINSKHISVLSFRIETLNRKMIDIKAYDKLADYVYRKLKIGNMCFFYGRLKFNFVTVERIVPFEMN